MPLDSLQGPLTAADLQAIWEGAVDRSYREPLVAAGEGRGFEAYTQAFEQIARASLAVDRSTQQMYLQPWSGQSGDPAAGASFATVELTISRQGYAGQALFLKAGLFVVDELQRDHGRRGGVLTNTGRRYVLQEDVALLPGECGPVTVLARADRPGMGYNNPLPGSISLAENAGTGLRNSGATVALVPGASVFDPTRGMQLPPVPALEYVLQAADSMDMPVPSNVGQYVLFTAGANEGSTALAQQFVPPDGPAGQGSGLVLAPILTFESYDVQFGPFVVGNPVSILALVHSLLTLVGVGTLVAVQGSKFAVLLLQGTAAGAVKLQQSQDGRPVSIASVDVVLQAAELTPEVGTAAWRILDWARDWQLAVTNAAQPSGGNLGMLDLLGAERDLPRQNSEDDTDYRERVWNLPDVVSPNAIRRALNLALVDLPWCYREVSNGLLPGIFYDREGDEGGDFYDDDSLLWFGTVLSGSFEQGDRVRYLRQVPASTGPWCCLAEGTYGGLLAGSTALRFVRRSGQAIEPVAGDLVLDLATGAVFAPTTSIANDYAAIRRWHVYLDHSTFRGYFAVEVPRLNFGEFGLAYDYGASGAYDAAPFPDGYDGYPAGTAAVYGKLWARLDKVRAGGVLFDLFLSDGPCI
jgi:hypothetical protein